MSPDFVECVSPFGEKINVSKERLIYRPAAYGIIVHDGKLLVSTMKCTGRLVLPGGKIEAGESAEDTLKREIHEECGIDARIGNVSFFKDSLFYYPSLDEAYKCHGAYYFCQALTFDVTDKYNEEGDESVDPRWIEITELKPDDFQVSGNEIIQALSRIE